MVIIQFHYNERMINGILLGKYQRDQSRNDIKKRAGNAFCISRPFRLHEYEQKNGEGSDKIHGLVTNTAAVDRIADENEKLDEGTDDDFVG